MFKLYVDGACQDGRGGWGVVIVDEDGKRTQLCGKEDNVTSNQMELLSAIKGLEAIPVGSQVMVYSDSQYLIYTMQGKFSRKANLSFWQRIDELVRERSVEWHWMRERTAELEQSHRLAWGQIQGGVRMVDVSEKPVTLREAVAKAVVRMSPDSLEKIKRGELVKGDVFSCAQIAGIMAAKKTPQLIPLCHPLPISDVKIELEIKEGFIEIASYVKGEGKTGFEMEALVGVAVAALTVYDMAKGVDPAMTLEVKLVRKSGGKSGVVELEKMKGFERGNK